MGAVGLIPPGDIDTQNLAQVGDQVVMVAMRGPPALVWIATDLRVLLFAIDRFDRGIHVQYPAILHYRMQRNCQVLLQPDFRFFLINGFQSSPHRVVTAKLAHPRRGGLIVNRHSTVTPIGVQFCPPAGRNDSWGGAAAGPARGDDPSLPFYANYPWLPFLRCTRRRSFHDQMGGGGQTWTPIFLLEGQCRALFHSTTLHK